MSHVSRFEPRQIESLKVERGASPVPSEHVEQRAFVEWFRKSGDVRIFAVPNGGGRGISQARKLKAEGVSAGVPDLFVPEWLLWIEMKRQKGGRVDPAQIEWHDYLRSIGHLVITPKGAHDAVEQVLGLWTELRK